MARMTNYIRNLVKKKNQEDDYNTEKNHYYEAIGAAIFNSVDDAIISVDTDLRVTEANKKVETICGLVRDDIVDKLFYSCNCQCSCFQILLKTIKEERPLKINRSECYKQQCQSQVVSLFSYPLKDKNDKLYGGILVIRDETRVNNLEKNIQEQQKYHQVIDKSNIDKSNQEQKQPRKLLGSKDDEYRTIIKVLEQTKWNKSKAAKILGINRSTLYLKLKKYEGSPDQDDVASSDFQKIDTLESLENFEISKATKTHEALEKPDVLEKSENIKTIENLENLENIETIENLDNLENVGR